MGEIKQGFVVVVRQSPVKQLESKYNEFESVIKNWLAKQSLPVEVTIVTAARAIQGAAVGGFMGTFRKDVTSDFPPPPPLQAKTSFLRSQVSGGGPVEQARNFAVLTGVNGGLSCAMRRLRGKEDVQSSMVAAFGSGVMLSLVNGMGSPNQAANAISSGVLFALVQGGIFKVAKKFSQLQLQTGNVLCNETRGVTDNTMSLVSNRQVETINTFTDSFLYVFSRLQA